MALSGLDIYKLLPRTNCKKCGFQTCLAFAMQLAKKAVALDKCPLVTPEVRATLEVASQPAIRSVEIGVEPDKVIVGNEIVLFRHEEKFHHPTALGFILEDTSSDQDLTKALDQIHALSFDRVGQKVGVQLVALKESSGKAGRFGQALDLVRKNTNLGLVLMPSSAATLAEALGGCAVQKPLVYAGTPELIEVFAELCRQYKVSLAFRASTVDEFSQKSKKIGQMGLPDLVFDIPASPINQGLWMLTQLRRLAIKKSERSVGFPTMMIVDHADEKTALVGASTAITKYASIVLLATRRPEYVLPLITLRQNIYTDPQKPLQVEPKVYPIGAAHNNSPVLITTNFSLTYYTVLGDIESSRIPCHLICVDTEGMSVLTAWAAEKFTAERIADTLVKFKLSEIVEHKNLIIPGYVSMMSGDLEEKSGWNILVGPREASGITSYLKNLKP